VLGGVVGILHQLRVNGRRDGQALAVWTSRPTARPAHTSPHLIDADLDAALSGGFLLSRCDPTDPLVAGQRGDIGPEAFGSGIKLDGFSEISRQLMDRAVCKLLSGHTSKCVCSA
jgi:hypothetical protein